MTDAATAQHHHIAKQAAKLFFTQLAGVPALAQLMTAEMVTKTIFMTDVKPEHRLELLDKWLAEIRRYVVAESKPKKARNDVKSKNRNR